MTASANTSRIILTREDGEIGYKVLAVGGNGESLAGGSNYP